MNVKLKLNELWIYFICFLIIVFISFVNGVQKDDVNTRTSVIIAEDPIVNKLTKVNHHLKLVKLKKVKKVYTNVQENENESDHQSSRKPTIINSNRKHNLATQTPIPFLIIDKPIDFKDKIVDKNLIDFKSDHHLHSTDSTDSNDRNLLKKTPVDLRINSNSKDEKSKVSNHQNDRNSTNHFKRSNNQTDLMIENDRNQRFKSSKVLFPSVNKFKNSLNHLTKPTSVGPNYIFLTRKSTNAPFFTKSTSTKIDFLNKTLANRSTFQVTTIKPMASTQTKKSIKSITTTTIEPPRTLKPNKKTTTYKPYVYSSSVTTTTIAPILRIRKSYPTTSNKIKIPVSNKPKLNDENAGDEKQSTKNGLEKERSDLESNNSNRKYAKLLLNNKEKSKTDERIIITTTPLSSTTASYLRNSRISTFPSVYTTELSQSRRFETTTENSFKNEIDRKTNLIGIRKRPISPRPRTVNPIQLTQLTTKSSLVLTTERPSTTESTILKFKTTYSPRFRSTTQTTLNEEFKTLLYSTTPMPSSTQYKENSFYRSKSDQNYTPTKYSITTESSNNDLMNNFLPRRSKWIMKGTRQRKSETTDLINREEITKSLPNYTKNPIEPPTSTSKSISSSNENSIDADHIKTADRATKSIESIYQTKSPKPFLIDETHKSTASFLNHLKYEEPKRKSDHNSKEESPDREIYYQDIKIRKESKLVPQTYLYSTPSSSLDQLNEKLAYLSKEKSKYDNGPYHQSPTSIYSNEDRNMKPYDESFERRPKYPENLIYRPVAYQNSKYNYKNELDQTPPLKTTTDQPYVRSHFNLGPSIIDRIPKYGRVDAPSNQQVMDNLNYKSSFTDDPKQIVGKLSKAFTNQAPIPYFSPENKDVKNKDVDKYKNNRPVDYSAINEQGNYNIDLKRIPIDHPYQPVSHLSNSPPPHEIENKDKNYLDLKPFDFANYKPLPNTKFIRTDLDTNEIPKRPSYSGANMDRPSKVDTHSQPLINNKPKYTQSEINQNPRFIQSSVNTLPLPPPMNDYQNIYSKPNDRLPKYSIDKGLKFKFELNKIPPKIIYDKYNQKFIGQINLKPDGHSSIPKHYANIPKHVHPIEYQPKIDTRLPNKSIINNYHNNIPSPNDYNRYKNDDLSVYKLQNLEYRPNGFKLDYQVPVRKPHYDSFDTIRQRPNNNNLRENNEPVRFYSDGPRFNPNYYQLNNNNQFNGQFDHLNNQITNQHDNRINRPQMNHQVNTHNQLEIPEFRKKLSNSKPLHNQFNAGHYAGYYANNSPRIEPYKLTNGIEFISLNDITPNLSLFNKKMPDFKLIHSITTHVSHDVPIDNKYSL